MGEADRLDRFVRGLRPRIRQEIRIRKPTTLAQATQIAEALDVNLDRAYFGHKGAKDRYHWGPRSSYSVQSSEETPKPNDPVAMELGLIGAPLYLTEDQKRYRRRNGLCLYCGEKGHKAAECPVKSRDLTNLTKKGQRANA